MGCIHCSKMFPEDSGRVRQDTKDIATRPGSIWRFIRIFHRNRTHPLILKTEITVETESNVPFAVTGSDNLSSQKDLLQDNSGPQQNDVHQDNICQNDVPKENFVPWHDDVIQESLPLQNNLLQNKLDSQNDAPQGNLDSIQVSLHLGQASEEEACDADLSDEEVDQAPESARPIDSLCEAGPLEHCIVNAYLEDASPSCSDKNKYDEAKNPPEEYTPISYQLRPILKKPGSVDSSKQSNKKVSFSSTIEVKTLGPDNAINVPESLMRIPICRCVGCCTGCEETELTQSIADFSSVSQVKKSDQQECPAASKNPVSKASCSRYWAPSARRTPSTSYSTRMPTFSLYRNAELESCEKLSKRRKKALEEIKILPEPTLVQKYAKLPTKGFLLDK